MNAKLSSIWYDALKLLKENPNVSESAYANWIEPLLAVGMTDEAILRALRTKSYSRIL